MNKLLVLIIFPFLLSGCVTSKMKLHGTWHFDNDRTLEELSKDPNVSKELLGCYKSGVCAKLGVLTFNANNTFTVGGNSNPREYEIIRTSKNKVEISAYVPGKNKSENIKFHFIDKSLVYIVTELQYGTFKEYLAKTH